MVSFEKANSHIFCCLLYVILLLPFRSLPTSNSHYELIEFVTVKDFFFFSDANLHCKSALQNSQINVSVLLWSTFHPPSCIRTGHLHVSIAILVPLDLNNTIYRLTHFFSLNSTQGLIHVPLLCEKFLKTIF